MLLRRMADFQPDLVEAAYTELGADRRAYMAAHNRWQTMLRSRRAPAGLDLYRAVLGPPDTERAERFGDVALTLYSWQLAGLWPDLRWEVVVGTGGVVLNGSLVRAYGSPTPELPNPPDIAPWSCVVGDVMMCFADAHQVDPEVPSQWRVFVKHDRLTFVHGLFQLADRTVT